MAGFPLRRAGQTPEMTGKKLALFLASSYRVFRETCAQRCWLRENSVFAMDLPRPVRPQNLLDPVRSMA